MRSPPLLLLLLLLIIIIKCIDTPITASPAFSRFVLAQASQAAPRTTGQSSPLQSTSPAKPTTRPPTHAAPERRRGGRWGADRGPTRPRRSQWGHPPGQLLPRL
ncbi:hypothetical protein T492DRAFT_141273 [Pavlovales sp. CCMP2436]|nr:hypothetical protein T492DRAFT_141273 [Pavlovales sp. CCMP2436]